MNMVYPSFGPLVMHFYIDLGKPRSNFHVKKTFNESLESNLYNFIRIRFRLGFFDNNNNNNLLSNADYLYTLKNLKTTFVH